MNVSYLVFLKEHLNYLIARMFALEDEEQRQMFRQIKNVRNLLNTHEEINNQNMIELF